MVRVARGYLINSWVAVNSPYHLLGEKIQTLARGYQTTRSVDHAAATQNLPEGNSPKFGTIVHKDQKMKNRR
jgi:hypothetical protein